ncbi:ATP-dependent helicase [Aureliella helgolandensis]|uniref:DNA 3'-5' helicase n=1 Tax=Aureliella helgolandensis TaxID=2527968 RepID=A0A518G3J6_9BACT|nr:UvrD-helicase domain-containing protein [Aureliella helgolandensis]QDV23140.1 ATP-dependent DNA helicase PcrA [Aureliella helgolandensis]
MSNGLNPEQQEAVQTLKGPMLVLAGAGSGKTRVVTFRIANLIRHGIRPDRILAVTFTNKAAKEMRERIGLMLGPRRRLRRGEQKPPTPVIGTFHSNCVQILRRHAPKLGYPTKFAIYDRGDQESTAREVLRQLRVSAGILKPGDFLSHVSRWKNAGVRPEQAGELARSDAEHMAASGYRRYQQAIKLAGAMDFDDLLLLTEQLFIDYPEARQEEAGRYDHVLVDEYQDTNQTQYAIIQSLAAGHRNLCVVGDDDQSIYGWRGAEVQHILNFRNDWQDAKVVRLEANYRSTTAILTLANRLIAFNKTRHDKVLKPARAGGAAPRVLQFKNDVEEARGVTEEIQRILESHKREARDFAILFRTNEQPRVFETELRKAQVPYSLVGSQSFFDRKEVRDLLSYMKMIDNPKDEVALLRIINYPQRGIGAKTVENLLADAVANGHSMWETMHNRDFVSRFPEPAKRGVERLQSIVARFKARHAEPGATLADALRDLVYNLDYMGAIERSYPTPEEVQTRQASVEEVINAVAEFEGEAKEPTLSGFLDNVALAGKEFGSPKEKEQQRNAVSLMTYHSAKGLEFPIVYMVGMEEGILPHRRSLAENYDDVEEERRLCYVGVTRAQDELTLCLPLQRMKWGKPRDTFASRFLYEMTGQADNPNRNRSIQGARKEIVNSQRAAARKKAKGAKPAPKRGD